MEKICQAMEQRFHCRRTVLRELVSYISNPQEAYPDALYIFGHSGTGKTAIFKHLLQLCKRRYKERLHYAYVNCVQCYTSKLLVSSIIEELVETGCFQPAVSEVRCNTLKDFVDILRSLHKQFANTTPPALIIGLDSAERLRDMDINVLPVLLRLQQLTALNVCVVLISQLPFEKYYTKTGLPDVLTVHCAQYSKNEMMDILCMDLKIVQQMMRINLQQQSSLDEAQLLQRLQLIDNIQPEFYNNYLNVFLSVFFKACRELPELKVTARKCFFTYMEPVLDGRIEAADVSRLWRHIVSPLRQALAQVYLRLDQAETQNTFSQQQEALEQETTSATTVRDMAKALELPYYGKYLLIAGFLASYNSPKYDKRLFVKHHGKQKKRMQTVNANAKNVEKMTTSLGPKSFSIDRLLAIFYAIIEEKVGLTCNLLSQISTLVHLKLLTFVSGEQNIMDGTAKLQCTVGLEFVLCIGKVVGFNVRQYLCDFM